MNRTTPTSLSVTRSAANPFNGTLLLMATILASELAMLNIIFWARAQGTVEGLAVATIWPWIVAFSAPLLGSAGQRWFSSRSLPVPVLNPRAAASVGLGLMAVVLLGRLALFA